MLGSPRSVIRPMIPGCHVRDDTVVKAGRVAHPLLRTTNQASGGRTPVNRVIAVIALIAPRIIAVAWWLADPIRWNLVFGDRVPADSRRPVPAVDDPDGRPFLDDTGFTVIG